MYGQLIQDFFTRAGSWAIGSAPAVIMLVVTLVLVAVARAADRRSEAGLTVGRAQSRRGSASDERGCRWARRTCVMLVLLYLPIVLLFVFSFNANSVLTLPDRGADPRLVRRGLRRRGSCSRQPATA